MIGLGSNRLTVCRRGGMSVTQAGRGGMEWLAGGRMPSWASPYSAQATAALLAQFPTQWPTIQDYGVAHPEIVGYMNAYAPEDAKIAYSLVPTLGVMRLIYGDGTGYFMTDIVLTRDAVITEAKAVYTNNQNANLIFGSYSASSSYYAVGAWSGNYFMSDGVAGAITSKAVAIGTPVTFRLECLNGKARGFIDGVQYLEHNASSLATLEQCLMGRNDSGTITGSTKHKVEYIRHKNANEEYVHYFVPFIRNNAVELLDMVTGQLAERHGTFQISETPAS